MLLDQKNIKCDRAIIITANSTQRKEDYGYDFLMPLWEGFRKVDEHNRTELEQKEILSVNYTSCEESGDEVDAG